jgi:Family of unknown function (DUF6185)
VVVDRIDDDLSRASEFGVFDLLLGITSEAAFWIVAAFVFGGLYAHLPGRQGPIKGAALGAVFAASLALIAAVSSEGTGAWTFRSLQMLLFLATLGFLIDRKTIEEQRFYWRELFDHYRLRELRFAAGYLSSLSIALIALLQQVLSGEAEQTITALIEAAGASIPDPSG